MIDNMIINFFNNLYFLYIFIVGSVKNCSFNSTNYSLLEYDQLDDGSHHDNYAFFKYMLIIYYLNLYVYQ